MKITAIYASPHQNGNSSTMVNRFLEHAKGAEIEKFYLNNLTVTECQGCGKCVADGSCILDDDMQKIYTAISGSDVIVMGSPLYWWSVSAELKAVIDRLYPYIGKGSLDGKKAVLLVSGISEVPNSGYDLIDGMFREISAYLNMKYYRYFASADNSRPAGENKQILSDIDGLAAEVM